MWCFKKQFSRLHVIWHSLSRGKSMNKDNIETFWGLTENCIDRVSMEKLSNFIHTCRPSENLGKFPRVLCKCEKGLLSHSPVSTILPTIKTPGETIPFPSVKSNYKVNGTKTVRDFCRSTGLMFPASCWLHVRSGCRSHAAYCFHILCSLSNGLLKTGQLLFWPPRLQSGMPRHCFPLSGW